MALAPGLGYAAAPPNNGMKLTSGAPAVPWTGAASSACSLSRCSADSGVESVMAANGGWTATWDAREAELVSLLGPTTGMVYHATIPFELGGFADVLEFREFVRGSTYVTADLTGPDSSQIPSSLGQYELMVCTREAADWAPGLISRLAKYTAEAVLEPFQTMDIATALPRGSTIAALLFVEPDLPTNEFHVQGERAGLLLCLGISAAELQACFDGRVGEVVRSLRTAGVFPFTDLQRPSVA
jgi:hypothetical protein